MPKELYSFDYVKLQKCLHQTATKAVMDILAREQSRETNFFHPYIMRVLHNTNCKLNCGQMHSVLNLDLNGNLYSCHNIDTPIGNIFDKYEDLIDKHNKWIDKNTPISCKQCGLYGFCKAVCPLENTDQKGNKVTCRYYQILFTEVQFIINSICSFLNINKQNTLPVID